MYLAWYDADRKKPTVQKIAEAHQRYVAKFGRQPLICLVNPEDAVDGAVVEVRPLNHIGRNCFGIGSDDVDEQRLPELPVTEAPAAKVATTRRSRKVAAAPEPTPIPVVTPVPERDAPVTLPKRRKTVVAKAEPQPIVEAPTPVAPAAKRRPRRERTAA